ncbi:MAG: hypothetical protein NW223_15095 [Hyphomicrobiaceae bacterium]|nr:hypothetical protein [Hyphomicrobiaceae bacterium]
MQLVDEAMAWLQAARLQVAGWDWLLIWCGVGVSAGLFAVVSGLVAHRRRKAYVVALSRRVERETEALKQELRRRLSEPSQLFDDHLNGAPTLGAREAFESDIEAAAASVLREAGGERRKARDLLRERLARDGAGGKGTLNGTEARTWRQLGALALVDGSPDALASYRRAAELAPEDLEAHLVLGVLSLRKGELDAADAAFRRLIELAHSATEARLRYRGRTMLGDVCAARHKPIEALEVYAEARREIEALLAAHPDEPALSRDLSVILDRIGDVHTTLGDLEPALASYQAGLAIAERLARAEGGSNPELLHDLSVSHDRIGDLLDRKGDLAGALGHLRRSLAITKALVRSDQHNAAWARDLSASYERVADILHAQGKVDQALKRYRLGLDIAEHLAAQAGIADAAVLRDLAVSYHKIGTLEAMGGRADAARELLEKGRGIIAHLDRIAAHRAQWRADLSKFDAALKTLH